MFIMIGGQIGVLTTLALDFADGDHGQYLASGSGFFSAEQIQMKAASGGVPGKELINGVMIMLAGVLLLTPGFVTDAIGFLLFFPPFRQIPVVDPCIAGRCSNQSLSTRSEEQCG